MHLVNLKEKDIELVTRATPTSPEELPLDRLCILPESLKQKKYALNIHFSFSEEYDIDSVTMKNGLKIFFDDQQSLFLN